MTTTSTTNYGFVKPTAGTGEPVSVQAHLDDNWDKVDQDMNRFDRQVFTATGTWNKPARCKRVLVQVIGGGGGSGGVGATASGQVAESGAGGGGGYSEKLFLASVLAYSETVTIGAAGTAGTSGGGGAGGDSSFATGKAYAVTATGGLGGAGGAATGGVNSTLGGAGGFGLSLGGGAGASAAFGGAAGMYSGSAIPLLVGGVGNVGRPYGGGASDAVNPPSTAAGNGSAGAAGVVIVTNYY